MSARDWIASLRPASYRGAPFFVDTDNWKTGRRLITHEFPLNDRPYIEDLGRSANTFSVTAYVASDEADSQAVALLRACDRGGVATLSLPLMRVQAHCQSASRQHSKDQLGYIAISMEFVRDGVAGAPFSLGAALRSVEAISLGVLEPAAGAFRAQFQTLSASQAVREAARTAVEDVAVIVDTALQGVTVGDGLGELRTAVDDIFADAETLARAGSLASVVSTTQVIVRDVQAESDLPKRLDALFAGMRSKLGDEAAAVALGAVLAHRVESTL